MNKKQDKVLNWDEFRNLGNPENVPNQEEEIEKIDFDQELSNMCIRVHLEKKGRGGKSVSIVKGIELDSEYLKELASKLKSYCGVGGSVKKQEIIIQGDQRDKIISRLREMGAKDIKKAGA